MCFFSKQTKKAVELEHRFKAKFKNASILKPSIEINGFTHPYTPVIINKEPNTINFLQWGLIPSWAKNEEIQQYTLNAKIETLTEKPSFKNSINKRCLVIADGFYEWQWLDKKGKNKQKYEITFPENEIFSFAGIWSQWQHPTTGLTIESYSILTTNANKLMAEIHNSKKRMPVILPSNQEKAWLDGEDYLIFKDLNIELAAKKITNQTSLF